MNIEIRKGDITTVETDAIVNAANSKLLGGGGVDGAIHRAAGKQLLAECRHLRETTLKDGLPAGQAVATDGYDLPARWVIHTVGPVYAKTKDKSDILASCYRESLRVADEIGATSVAFPAISAGIYGWPMDSATQIAVNTVLDTDTTVETVVFVPFSADAEAAFQSALDAARA
ncbi:O-acetyl-ADP-ribose deacetylase [Kocuria rhizophila]|uniref:O-acetyl-ADP-ribose deacetylase n=1 Tax=Kocuria rhizophila TaxID=72000 RepID=UPI00174A8556|nr:O-acetyl-ADP-ribose deacetylase [Kocuria rhizophila]MCT1456849.1 O-acetyl-ADP-ribose deacetylase [Kocuria rhizophila]MCT1879966.1 O-acetyl-ADP-ribose deacetylase [Kocuria rhizophila]MCT2249843.1 O-acetyl-ADP-ribose deacetylase [Kocuria rhizophila]